MIFLITIFRIITNQPLTKAQIAARVQRRKSVQDAFAGIID
jgi:hypothetical protein